MEYIYFISDLEKSNIPSGPLIRSTRNSREIKSSINSLFASSFRFGFYYFFCPIFLSHLTFLYRVRRMYGLNFKHFLYACLVLNHMVNPIIMSLGS